MEALGPTLTKVLKRAYQIPFTSRSDFARQHAEWVAMCACEGLITTRLVGTEEYGKVWHITVMGLLKLREIGEADA